MLERVALRNFKSFDETGVDLRPGRITVLIGANGTGKSSVLQSLALVKQSRQQDHFELDGRQVNLGTFRDLVHHQQTNRRVSISLSASYRDFNVDGGIMPSIPGAGTFAWQSEFVDRDALLLNEGSVGVMGSLLYARWSPALSRTDPEQVTFDDGKTVVELQALNRVAYPLAASTGTSAVPGARINEVMGKLRELFLT
ncbi:MAG: AAA family ATPase, partial [Candidatus Dormibacteraceae bacterium]